MTYAHIKENALKFSNSPELIKSLAMIDSKLVAAAIKEIQTIKRKWKSLDNFIKHLISKFEKNNEGLGSDIILTTFGIHATLKLLNAIKDNWGFWKYIGRLFCVSEDGNETTVILKTLRDIIISVTFIIWSIGFAIQNTNFFRDDFIYKGVEVSLGIKWSGSDNYYIQDQRKTYFLKQTSYGNLDLSLDDKIIGKVKATPDGWIILNLKGESILFDSDEYKNEIGHFDGFDLEKALTGGYNDSKIQDRIKKIEAESEILKAKSDSIDVHRKSLFESVDLARKLISSKEGISEEEFKLLKDILSTNNNMGYYGPFVNLILNIK